MFTMDYKNTYQCAALEIQVIAVETEVIYHFHFCNTRNGPERLKKYITIDVLQYLVAGM